MIIDLSSIIHKERVKLEFDSVIHIGRIHFMGTLYDFSKSIRLIGDIQKTGDTFHLTADVKGSVIVNCFRCTKELEKDLNFTMHEILTNNDNVSANNEEIIHFKGNHVDVTDIVVNNALMNMPTKYLCSEDCRGLCPECGADLNIEKCNCINDNIDPRLEVLKRLLNQ
ncbi:MAG: DUF177 domain-containing protein [Clostridia bacterium]